jgi:hypothetical protein
MRFDFEEQGFRVEYPMGLSVAEIGVDPGGVSGRRERCGERSRIAASERLLPRLKCPP